MARPRPLAAVVRDLYPELRDVDAAIAAGEVRVDGAVVTNPRSGVRAGSSVVARPAQQLRGLLKLRAALAAWPVRVAAATALDAGAAAGGFTQALLEAGARRVYAVDAGFGQLLGALRQDPRVVNLERTNLAALDGERVPEPIELVTLDLSYLPLADGVRQLERVELAPGAELVALVKPMFELRRPSAPIDDASLDEAVSRARDGVAAAGWRIVDSMPSPVTGARGAREGFVYARRA